LNAYLIAEQMPLIFPHEFEAHVDDLRLVVGREADPPGDVSRGPEALRVQHPDRDDLRVGGQPGECDAVPGPLSDRPGDVGAVPVAIEGHLVAVDEVEPRQELRPGEVGAPLELGLLGGVGDPGIEDRDASSLSATRTALLQDRPGIDGVQSAAGLEGQRGGRLAAERAAGQEVPLGPLPAAGGTGEPRVVRNAGGVSHVVGQRVLDVRVGG
jgi:hypothetical protein